MMKVSKTLLNVICPFTKYPVVLANGRRFCVAIDLDSKWLAGPLNLSTTRYGRTWCLSMTSMDNPDVDVRVHENY